MDREIYSFTVLSAVAGNGIFYFSVVLKNDPFPVKLVIPALFADTGLIAPVRGLVQEAYGPLDRETAPLPWNHTDYYTAEMGGGLSRVFFIPGRLIDRRQLASIKRQTILWEEQFAEHGKRRVNLDPGYLSEGQLVLASTKDFFHRIYLDQGIYAEVTLYYKHNEFHNLPWTYPDYATEEYKKILKEIRAEYQKQLEPYK
jgi:hypothetical protein